MKPVSVSIWYCIARATGFFSETYDLTVSGNAWPASLSASSVTLDPGEGTTVILSVVIPDDSSGQQDVVTATATSQTAPVSTDSVELTTTSESAFLYMPAILRE